MCAWDASAVGGIDKKMVKLSDIVNGIAPDTVPGNNASALPTNHCQVSSQNSNIGGASASFVHSLNGNVLAQPALNETIHTHCLDEPSSGLLLDSVPVYGMPEENFNNSHTDLSRGESLVDDGNSSANQSSSTSAASVIHPVCIQDADVQSHTNRSEGCSGVNLPNQTHLLVLTADLHTLSIKSDVDELYGAAAALPEEEAECQGFRTVDQRTEQLYSSNVELADDDGYIDEVYVVSSAAVPPDTRHQLCDDADAALDDFIDADMPQNVRSSPIGGSSSNSSLSSLHDEQLLGLAVNGMEENTITSHNGFVNIPQTLPESADALMSESLRHPLEAQNCHVPALSSVADVNLNSSQSASNLCGMNANQNCMVEHKEIVHSSHAGSESSFGTPPASLPSPNCDPFGGVDVAVALASSSAITISDDDTFEDEDDRLTVSNGRSSACVDFSDKDLSLCSKHRRNEYFWLPMDTDPTAWTSSTSPMFGCWSCFYLMDGLNPPTMSWTTDWRVVHRSETCGLPFTGKFNASSNLPLSGDNAEPNGLQKQYSMDTGAVGSARGCCDGCPYRRQFTGSAASPSSQMSTSLVLDDRRMWSKEEPHGEPTTSSHHSTPAFRTSRLHSSLRLKNSSDLPCRATWSCLKNEPWETCLDSSKSSSCSTVAVIRLLHMLGVEHNSREVGEMMHVNHSTTEKTDLCDFLKSQSQAGITADRLINSLTKITSNRVYGKFFSFHPRRRVKLAHWLASWISLGAVPLATLKFSNKSSPTDTSAPSDCWQHLTIYNVLPTGIVIGDSLSVVPESELLDQLAADSSIRLHRSNIVSRWRDDCDLGVLAIHPDPRWSELNVLGQVINILRESRLPSCYGSHPSLTYHLTLPTHHNSGITIFVDANSPAAVELQRESTDMLPLESPSLSSPSTASGSSPATKKTPAASLTSKRAAGVSSRKRSSIV